MRLTILLCGLLAIGLSVEAKTLSAQSPAIQSSPIQIKTIDVNQSTLTIRVFCGGVFASFAHNHEIQAPIEEGSIDSARPGVQLRVASGKMQVLDPEISADKRAEIQHMMQSSSVLDVEHFPEISYQSTSVTSKGEGRWEVDGILSLHGKKEPVVVAVSSEGGHYRGSASLNQTAFGIEPIRIAGGTVKVKDEVKIEFDIVPAK